MPEVTTLFSTVVDAIGPEAGELIDGGVVILFASGAPPELAEVSVTHDVLQAGADAPRPGDRLRIGDAGFAVTAVGATAWQKTLELGHVVLSFTGAATAERPGEICVEPADGSALRSLLVPGVTIELVGAPR